jgi:hypothetical protein
MAMHMSVLNYCVGNLFMLSATKWIVVHYTVPLLFLHSHGATASNGPEPTHYRGFKITLRHTTLGGTPLDE